MDNDSDGVSLQYWAYAVETCPDCGHRTVPWYGDVVNGEPALAGVVCPVCHWRIRGIGEVGPNV